MTPGVFVLKSPRRGVFLMSEVPLYTRPVSLTRRHQLRPVISPLTTQEATQGQIDGFLSQLSYKCHQNRVASLGD